MGAGRPLKFNNKEEMQEAIDKYFRSCYKPVVIFNKEKCKYETILDKDGNEILEQFKPFTITGLADALDMSRQALINYSEREEFVDTITRAKRKCEIYSEERLFDRDGNRGAIFSLSNNFKGWTEKQQIEMTKEPIINITINDNKDLQEEFYKEENNG